MIKFLTWYRDYMKKIYTLREQIATDRAWHKIQMERFKTFG